MESERIAALEKQNQDLHIRLRALEYSFMLSLVAIPPGMCKVLADGFGPLQQEILKTMTDAEARENVEVTKKVRELMRHVFAQGQK
ncbi:MAG: hypothetical protein QM578_12630 [Pantoea sp.]|uniref:hypothetical protein n=1 Tax=Pantoea sp. TaxID=69393 RepID=UPI0039E353A2